MPEVLRSSSVLCLKGRYSGVEKGNHARNARYTDGMSFPITTLSPDQYPPSLREIPHIPKHLYCRGKSMDESKHVIAVVGARRHSDYGRKACEKIITDLAGYPITVISGLAIGIDAIAHETAIASGLTTVAVVGSGLDDSVLYPAVNKPLAQRILEHDGSLISELEPQARATKYTFPSRNRIMAGLAEIVIAVECELKSGTRITTRLATEYNKEVGAVPHSIFSEVGAGTNALIQQGAHVIRDGRDVIELLGLETPVNTAVKTETLTDAEQKVYNALNTPKTKTMLSQETNLSAQELQSAIAALEMKDVVIEMMGTVQRR